MSAERCVLIVEDNPRNLKLVRDVLNHVGYRTLEACERPRTASSSRARSNPASSSWTSSSRAWTA